MARGKQTARMTTGSGNIPRSEPAIALNRDGSVQRDPQKDRLKDRIKKMKADFQKAMAMMDEALEIMDHVEDEFLDLEKYFPELKENN